jgi:prevent-host-death family protein
MNEVITITEARNIWSELMDRVNVGLTYILSSRGQALAVLIGIEEYERLKSIEEHYRQKDFDTLLSPPSQDSMAKEAARELAVKIIREHRS